MVSQTHIIDIKKRKMPNRLQRRVPILVSTSTTYDILYSLKIYMVGLYMDIFGKLNKPFLILIMTNIVFPQRLK